MVNIAGSITVITDINFLLMNPSYEILAMTEFDEEIEHYKDTLHPIPSTILLPQYDALQYFVDQDIESFANMYMIYLASSEVSRFLAVIFKAMMLGKHFAIYVPVSEYNNTPFVSVLYDFIFINYGIRLGMPNAPYTYDANNLNLLNLLYNTNLMNFDEYLKMYPKGISLPYQMIGKLMVDYQIIYPDPTIDYLLLFNNIKDSSGQSISPIQYSN